LENNIGCLIFHGFAGNRKELSPLIDKIKEYGYVTVSPLLTGHEATRRELALAKLHDWLKTAEDAIKEMEQKCNKIVIVGFSMGGLISVNLCQKHKVYALVLINTPIYYWDIKRIIRNILSDFRIYIKKYFTASTSSPIPALFEFLTLLKKTKPLFNSIDCSTLIIQTLDDDTVNPKSADYIYSQLTCKKKIKKYLTGGHVVFDSSTCEELCSDVIDFLDKLD
jgi:carboxylesterase